MDDSCKIGRWSEELTDSGITQESHNRLIDPGGVKVLMRYIRKRIYENGLRGEGEGSMTFMEIGSLR